MLSKSIKPGTLLIGLAKLINSGKPGFDGHYRALSVGREFVIEFFEGPPDGSGELPVKILPYRPNMINTVAAGGSEVISGEFTGCVMSLFKENGTLMSAHVDTNADTTQRAAYDALKGHAGFELVTEYDTTGKLGAYPGLTGDTRLLCVAGLDAIEHYFVDRELHQYHTTSPGPGGGPATVGLKSETRYRVLKSFGQ